MQQEYSSNAKSYLRTLAVTLLAGSLFACGGSNSNPFPDDPGGGDNDPDPTPESVELGFSVQTYGGARLSDVSVTLGEDTAQSDDDGYVLFSLPSQDTYVVRAEADGFITQALKVDGEADGITPIRLTAVKQTLSLADIEAPRTLSANDLGARITFPADAFVTPDGEPATGSATVQITPWDITNGELTAMPGNGQAIDAAGDAVELISAGMLTVDIHNADGDYLQLSPGATAEIQMDLPVASINNEALSVGSTIPMWHFDEAQGEWVEDDSIMGTVVQSPTSPVGLAVYAEVSHFSTWNWDFKFVYGGSIHVECRLEDNSATPCGIGAEVILDDGSMFSRNGHLPAGGSTIINMPNSATIHWSATSAGGLIGEQTTDMSGDVVIELGEPDSSNHVRCLLPDETPVACSVTLTDGVHSLTQAVPAAGANIVTAWPNLDEHTELEWVAETPAPISHGGQQVLAEGVATSGITGNVDIALDTTPIDDVEVQCQSANGTVIPCLVDFVAIAPNGDQVSESDVYIQSDVSIAIPSASTLIQWSAESDGAYSQNGQFVLLAGSMETGLVSSVILVLDEEVVQGPAAQSVEVFCTNSQDTAATSCDIEAYVEGSRAGYAMLGSFDDVLVGESVTLEFPEGMSSDGEWVQLMATGDDGSQTSSFSPYGSLNDGESIELELQCAHGANGGNCP
ncbi:hypothetical protein [Marinimicrobium alkaliphilum]|uniref:hypothetical protein n=1 Tax=Marinimicrobium alkaliphilum TaxID=2202654 RepID=UPI001300983D|nr:hypothetical protein [Marinimicrobium alkaliphilum]